MYACERASLVVEICIFTTISLVTRFEQLGLIIFQMLQSSGAHRSDASSARWVTGLNARAGWGRGRQEGGVVLCLGGIIACTVHRGKQEGLGLIADLS